jgi:hypothetical protein
MRTKLARGGEGQSSLSHLFMSPDSYGHSFANRYKLCLIVSAGTEWSRQMGKSLAVRIEPFSGWGYSA